MKLLYITNGTTGAGGLERVLSIKASYLADQMGYEVHILTLNDAFNEQFYTFSPAITFHDVVCKGGPLSYFSKYIKGIRRVVKQLKPDVISVCDDGLKGFYVPLFLGGKPCPMIYERHASKLVQTDGVTNFKQRLFSFFMNLGSLFYNNVVVLTDYNKTEWPWANVYSLANPLSFYPDSIDKDLKEKRILCVGSLSYNKGQDLLVEAWANCQQKAEGWELHFYGKGDTNKLMNQADRFRCTDTIKFFPPTSEIELAYKSSSIYALPSRSEGFGMVLIEAMACGLPCVSFDCPCGPRDIIRDNEDGFLVENGNVEAMAAKLLELIENKEKRATMGLTARENVKRYAIEHIAFAWDQLFKELC